MFLKEKAGYRRTKWSCVCVNVIVPHPMVVNSTLMPAEGQAAREAARDGGSGRTEVLVNALRSFHPLKTLLISVLLSSCMLGGLWLY